MMNTNTVVLLLSLLLGIQPVTTDLYLPALPALTADLQASVAQTQLTFTGLLLAFGVSQLVWGPVSDRWGRRPVLLAGSIAYVVAALGATAAPNIESLIAWRTLQGAAMGAAVMCARAIVRDLYNPVDGARAMSRGLTGLGVIACVCAPLGGLLSDLFDWRAALLALAIFGAVTLAVVALRFKESLVTRNPQALQVRSLAASWMHILRNPCFLAQTSLATAAYGGLFTFLAASSFVFIEVLGYSKTSFGLWMASMPIAYIVGTFWCRRMLPRLGPQRSVAVAAGVTLAGGTLMGVLGLAGVRHGAAIMIPFYLYMIAHGVHQPCSQSGAVAPFPTMAGTASALSGFAMMLAAFGIGAWLGVRIDGTVLPLTNGVWLFSVLIALAAWGPVRWFGEARGASA